MTSMPNKPLAALMSTTPNTLAKAQHDALQAHVLSVLGQVAETIRERRYEKDLPTFFSPSGGDMGADNTCINFAYSGSEDDVLDIDDVYTKLRALDSLATRGPL